MPRTMHMYVSVRLGLAGHMQQCRDTGFVKGGGGGGGGALYIRRAGGSA